MEWIAKTPTDEAPNPGWPTHSNPPTQLHWKLTRLANPPSLRCLPGSHCCSMYACAGWGLRCADVIRLVFPLFPHILEAPPLNRCHDRYMIYVKGKKKPPHTVPHGQFGTQVPINYFNYCKVIMQLQQYFYQLWACV